MFWFGYNLIFHVVYLLMLPHFLLRMRRRGGYRQDFSERWFRLSEEKSQALSDHRRIWVHAVSVGEFGVGLAFIREWRRRHPDAKFLVTINTSTAHALAEEKLSEQDVLLYPPVDSPWVIRRVLKQVQVEALVLVETEMWPNLLRGLDRKGIPVMLLNGRISDRSYGRLQKITWMTRRLYSLVTLYAMQSERDAERARGLGAPAERVRVMHSAKYDVAQRNLQEEQTRRDRLEASGFLQTNSRILLGSSTWPGEEKVLMQIVQDLKPDFPELRLILVPRHFERRQEVIADAEDLSLSVALWSENDEESMGQADAVMVDTTGELMHFTGLADRVFIGKSLFRSEGQNPLEACHAGKWTVTGLGMKNFHQVMLDLNEVDAILQVEDEKALAEALRMSLTHAPEAEAQGERARALVESRKGALDRSADALEELLKP